MLIGIDANEANLTQNRVGINKYAHSLLHALYRNGTQHQYAIYLKTPPLSDMPKPKSNWEYRVIPFPKLWTQTRLPWDLFTRPSRPDVFLSLTHYAPRWSPVPSVVTITDLGFLKYPEQFTPKDLNQLRSWTAYSVRQARRVIAISEHTKADIVSAYGIDPEKIVVTYLACDQSLFKPTSNIRVLNKHKIRRPYFLFLGSLKPSKNIPGVIKAFSAGKFPHQLVIAGKKGWMYDSIFSLVRELRLESKVIFTGFVSEKDVPALMTMADAFVMPSFYEGFGFPILEAMACGSPVVTSKVSSLPEVAGDAAVYVDPNSISSILTGLKTAIGPRRETFVKLGFKRLKLFSWEKTAAQTLAILKQAATK